MVKLKNMAEIKKNSNVGLERFLTAQDGQRGDCTLYELALKEIREGKLGFECWIRYVYPQLKRKGTSQLTDFYGLDGREEASRLRTSHLKRKTH